MYRHVQDTSPLRVLFRSDRITAFAGSGKTHTLRLLASAYPSLKILYLTFNRWGCQSSCDCPAIEQNGLRMPLLYKLAPRSIEQHCSGIAVQQCYLVKARNRTGFQPF
eukprot:1159813-Pelagomonas_calceolata.AAC.22